MSKSILFLAGDGIGPEVMGQVRRVIDWLNATRSTGFEVIEDLVGGVSIDAHGVPLTDAALERAKQADAVLLGAVGGPKWDSIDFNIRPEAGLLALRKELQLFANLRPALVFDALIDASSLKPEIIRGLDIMIVRELTGGVYFGEPRGIEDLPTAPSAASTPKFIPRRKSSVLPALPSTSPASVRAALPLVKRPM